MTAKLCLMEDHDLSHFSYFWLWLREDVLRQNTLPVILIVFV